ncbi:hypothetical protein Cgig2_006642 [Carnegiea gigantea]|uniref:PB1-like domain-containing protein n=1 Tax=Carnegiea gigantea TaxID=171969 RepID=A0A9Q1JNS1_9CARY|nr:hypothetical protein Cgig2_006642 [Carnegiea gigantea]
MSVDDIVVEIHHGEKFVDGDKVEYVGGGVSEIKPVDIDRLSRFEIIGLAKDIEFTNVEKFYYVIPGMSLREGLRTCHNDFESLDMIVVAAVNKRLVEVVPEMPAVPCPSTARQQSNVDPMSSSFNYVQQDQIPTPTPTPTPISAAAPIPSLTSTTQKAHSHDTTPNFNVNNEHVPEWDWEDPRPESPILWDKLIEGESLNEESNDSEYVPKTEVDLKAFEDITGSISKARGKRKINVGGGVDDDGCEIDGDEHDWDTDIEDEWEAVVEDLETTARAKVGECKKQKGSRKIDNAQLVGKQDMTANKSTEMDTDGETDGDVPRLLRKKEKPIKVDEHTDFKKLKWQVRMTFGIVQGFKDAISRFAMTQGEPREQGAVAARGRGGSRGRRGRGRSASFGPQSMIDQGHLSFPVKHQ